jgi:PAS domain S-box-containing protein
MHLPLRLLLYALPDADARRVAEACRSGGMHLEADRADDPLGAARRLNAHAYDALVTAPDTPPLGALVGTAPRPEALIVVGEEAPAEGPWSRASAARTPEELEGALRAAAHAAHRMRAGDEGDELDRLRLFEAAVLNTGDSILVTEATLDAPGPRIVYVNPAFERLTGYTLAEVRGKTPRILQGALTDRDLLQRLRADLAATRSFEGHTYNYRKDGKPYIVHWRIEPITDAAGEVTHWVAVQRDVTDFETVVARLSRARETLQLTLSIAEIGTWEQKKDTDEVTASDSLNVLFGLELGEVHPLGAYLERLHPDDRERFAGALARAMQTEGALETDVRVESPQRGTREVAVRGSFHMGGGESRPRLVATLRDVTDARQAERERNRVLQRNTEILDSITEAFFSVSTSGKLRWINTAAERLLETPGRSVSGRSFLGHDAGPLLDRLGAARLADAIAEVNATQRRVLLSDYAWRERVLDVNLFPYEAGVSVYLHDVTDRHIAEQMLRRNEERFQQAVRGTSDGIYHWNLQTDEVYLSPRYYEMFGYAPGAFPASFDAIRERTHPEDMPFVLRRLEAHFARKTDRMEIEYRMRCADGSWRWVLGRGVAEFDGDVPVRLAGSVVDISRRKADERALRQVNEEMERVNRSLETRVDERTSQLHAANEALALRNRELADFAFVASHDLQEPLRKISAFGGLLADEFGSALGEQGNYYVDRMRDASTRMSALISDLLEYSRVTSRGRPFVPVDLVKTFERVAGDLSLRLNETGGTLTLDAPGDLPAVTADATQLYQLLLNLVGNALKFNREGVPPVVTVRLLPDETVGVPIVRIEVADNGIGFKQEQGERIFAPFQRLHGRDAYEGTGIGLAICRRIVERHGGTISVQSQPGEGTTFAVALPLTPAADVAGTLQPFEE